MEREPSLTSRDRRIIREWADKYRFPHDSEIVQDIKGRAKLARALGLRLAMIGKVREMFEPVPKRGVQAESVQADQGEVA